LQEYSLAQWQNKYDCIYGKKKRIIVLTPGAILMFDPRSNDDGNLIQWTSLPSIKQLRRQ
jgi:hypothetical protein